MNIVEIPFEEYIYYGENGRENMKRDIKEIMNAVGDEFDFVNLVNEVKDEINEAAYNINQESKLT